MLKEKQTIILGKYEFKVCTGLDKGISCTNTRSNPLLIKHTLCASAWIHGFTSMYTSSKSHPLSKLFILLLKISNLFVVEI